MQYKTRKTGYFPFLNWVGFVVCILSCAVFTEGCAKLKEAGRGILGISTRELESNRKNAVKKTFNYELKVCYDKTLEILSRIGSYIYAKDQKENMVAIYVSEHDTTPVGIFFKEIDAHNTEVEIASPSEYTKESVAQEIFSGLEKNK